MALITISRGSYSKGKDIAEKVAEKLEYECISRDILIETSEHFNIPETKLVRALHDAPSILDRFTYGKERYIAFIKKAFLEHMVKDNVVYHGLAGHFFLKNVRHNLKVRIIADIEDRIKLEMERENISEKEARHLIEKDDHERRKWSIDLYGIDTADCKLYDMALHIHKLQVDDVVDLICHATKLPHFQTTPESQQATEDLLLASTVEVAIVQEWPNIKVSAKNDSVYIHTEASIEQEANLEGKIRNLAENVPGVKEVKISFMPYDQY